MGMSASQARFLSLTARKTNVEYEGQQINQQRTALSNESSNYYSQLTSMSVPTPPSSADYSKVTYTFQDGNEKNTVTSLIARPNGLYKLNYVMEVPTDDMVANGTNIVTKRDDSYYIGATQLRNGIGVDAAFLAAYAQNNSLLSEDELNSDTWIGLGSDEKIDLLAEKEVDKATRYKELRTEQEKVEALENYYVTKFKNALPANWAKTDIDGKYLLCIKQTAEFIQSSTDVEWFRENEKSIPQSEIEKMSDEEIESLLNVERQYLAMLETKYNQADWMLRYTKNSGTGAYEPVFYSTKELESADYSAKTGASLSGIKTYVYGESTDTKEIKNATARVEQDTSGRFICIMIYDDKDDTEGVGSYTKYDLTTTTESDEAGYNDAMNQYFYDKAQYDKKIQEVNSKIEIIQVQDKNLELKLKQLDTEENAISTELDAVKKVISKNVESSFKTFNA